MALRSLVLVQVFVLIFSAHVFSHQIVHTLPGYSDELPFKLETGYVGVGDMEELQFFYYFIESERNPERDPLILWLTGGPGCSGFSGLVYQIGPLYFDYDTFHGSLPSLILNEFSWTKFASLLFLDAPVGTGFSYSTTQDGYYSSDTKQADDIAQFLRKWIIEHPNFANNPLYICGDSYIGKILPLVAVTIATGNEVGHKPYLHFQGYTLGNPVTDLHNDERSRAEHFYQAGIISTELYEDARKYCVGEYVSANRSNDKCMNVIENVAKCILIKCDGQILESNCSYDTPRSKMIMWGNEGLTTDSCMGEESPVINQWCESEKYVPSYIWGNDVEVQKALHIRNNTIRDWKRCNNELIYNQDILSVVSYHKILIESGYRALVYSGDDDMLIPYAATLNWIHSLNFTIVDDWRPWFVEGQVAGFTMKFVSTSKPGDGLVFNTVKGGGHTGPEHKPKECFAMAERWLSYDLM